jgi:Flp pilus assembly protein TadG
MGKSRPNLRQARRRARRGATVVEFAIVGPVVLLLLIGFAILSLGVFRYQQIAHLAREGARYASSHGAQYRSDHHLAAGDAAAWTQDIRDQAVVPGSTVLDPNHLTVAASWSAGHNRANAGDPATGFTTTVNNVVSVTVTYQWIPEGYLAGPINLTSTAAVPMAY